MKCKLFNFNKNSKLISFGLLGADKVYVIDGLPHGSWLLSKSDLLNIVGNIGIVKSMNEDDCAKVII